MERVLVSACLLGSPVRYDGRGKRSDAEVLWRWRAEGRLVSFCPEVRGGLPTPRPPAEVQEGAGGRAVLEGMARVLTAGGDDVTAEFVRGAELALEAAERNGARIAILKEGSPSCGSSRVYDGTFTGRSIAGIGVTAALLSSRGIKVFSENELEEASAYLHSLETA